MHVLHLGFEDPAMPGSGGGSLRTAEIGTRLAAAGHRVTVLTTRFPGCEDRTSIHSGEHGTGSLSWVHIGVGTGGNRATRLLGYVLTAPLYVRSVPSDVVVEDFCAPFSSMGVPWWSTRPTVGVVQWLNAREKSREYHVPVHLVEKLGVRSHSTMIAMSRGVADKLHALAPHAEVEVIGNGVDPLASSVTTFHGDDGRDVVFVGRLEIAQKGLDLLLDAWATASREIDGDLVVVGTGPDEQALREQAARLGVTDRVRFAGRVDGRAKFELLAAARVVAMPSRFETFGIVAAEALAVGTPVVAYDIDCLREIVPADCGVLVPLTGDHAVDADAYANELVALHQDRARIDRAARCGPIAAQPHDWDVLARAQEAVYQGVHQSVAGAVAR